MVGICHDVTQEKTAAQRMQALNTLLEREVAERTASLHQAVEMANRANQAKSDFLANMSHEIRTPLNAVLGMAYLLQRQTLPPSAREMVETIHRAGRGLLDLINDILDVSKIEARRLELADHPFLLSEVIAQLDGLVRPSTLDKPVRLIIQPLPAGIHALVGDRLRLGQILLNLTGNAVKFTREGEVTVSVVHLLDDVTPASHARLRFSVQDTGVGIAADKLEQIFEAFSQADSSITRHFGGTGLGLTICRYLVEMMGGQLTVRSTPGHGSEFRFDLTLPRADPGADLGEAQPQPPIHAAARTGAGPDSDSVQTRLRGVRLLVVDDSDINRDVAARIFISEGATVQLASDGQQAIDHLQQQSDSVDVVLMDIHMPVMDGIAATRALRACPATAQLPIIALSASALSTEQQAAQAAGMDDFIAKPLDVERAVATIRRIVSCPPAQALQPPKAATVAATEAPVDRPDSTTTSAATIRPEAGITDFPAGLARWQDEQLYKQYLRRFMQECTDLLPKLREHLEQGDTRHVARVAHQWSGAAANLSLLGVAQRARDLDTHVRQTGVRLNDLAETLAATRALAAVYAGPLEPPIAPPAVTPHPPAPTSPWTPQQRQRLADLVQAVTAQEPDAIEALLDPLADTLGAAALQPLRRALLDFDFRTARQVALNLAESAQILSEKSHAARSLADR